MPGVAWGMSLTAIRSAEVCFTSWRARLVSTRQPARMSARATSHPLYQKGTTTCLQHLSTWRAYVAKYGQQASGHARAENGMWTQTPTVDFRPLEEALSAPASKAAYDCTHEKDGLEDGLSRCGQHLGPDGVGRVRGAPRDERNDYSDAIDDAVDESCA